MLAGLQKVRQQWTVQNRSVKRPKHQRFWENSSQLMLVLPLIPFSRASIPTLPARSLSEINFTASKLKDQVPTTTAILTVRLIMDWKLALSPVITGPKDFQVTSQKIARTFKVLFPSRKDLLKNKLLCKFSTWERFPFWKYSYPRVTSGTLRNRTADGSRARQNFVVWRAWNSVRAWQHAL